MKLQLLRFAKSVKEWLQSDPENVIVVHCKGMEIIKMSKKKFVKSMVKSLFTFKQNIFSFFNFQVAKVELAL